MNGTIAMITARGLLGRRRFLLLLILPLVLVAITVLAVTSGVAADHWAGGLIDGLGFGAVVPLVALVVGTGVLGNEVDDGTLVHSLATPLARREIVLTKLAVAVAASLTAVAPAMFVTGVLADGIRLGVGLAAGAALAVVVYCALFVVLSLVSTRPVLIGLGYVVIWEGLLGSFLTGTKVLAVRQYALAVADRVADTDLLKGTVSLPVVLILSTVIAVGATVFAVEKLKTFRIAGETG
jgi:ABC-2 type transport system permease protein